MPDFRAILPKLKRLREDREVLEGYRELSREEFLGHHAVRGDTCYTFITAIQGCVDIAVEIIAIQGYRAPKDMADTFIVLGEVGILAEAFAQRLTGMVRFRNILAHRYRSVDFDRVYDHLQDNLGDFDEFARSIVEFLEAQNQRG